MSVFSGLQGHVGEIVLGSRGTPTEWRHLMNGVSSFRIFSTSSPIRVMILMETATYAESVHWMPILDSGDPTGPMLNGITYIVRPVWGNARI